MIPLCHLLLGRTSVSMWVLPVQVVSLKERCWKDSLTPASLTILTVSVNSRSLNSQLEPGYLPSGRLACEKDRGTETWRISWCVEWTGQVVCKNLRTSHMLWFAPIHFPSHSWIYTFLLRLLLCLPCLSVTFHPPHNLTYAFHPMPLHP